MDLSTHLIEARSAIVCACIGLGCNSGSEGNSAGFAHIGGTTSETSVSSGASDETGDRNHDEGIDEPSTDESSNQEPSKSSSSNPDDHDSTTGKSNSSDEDSIRFDVGVPDVGEQNDSQSSHSYIWIANSTEGTVSKIDTRTVVEKGRYFTAPEHNDPSRTSVNLNGDVAVSGRRGGITKIYTDSEDCLDKNGSGRIETSIDSTPLGYANEECVAWHVSTPYPGQRGTAWTQGKWNPTKEVYEGQDLWVASLNRNPLNDGGEAILYDGETGERKGIAFVPSNRISVMGFSYGGVVDEEGNFWLHGQRRYLRKVDRRSFEVRDFPMTHPAYGIAYGGMPDGPGYVWTCWNTIGRFDPRTERWTTAEDNLGSPDKINSSSIGGCMVDGEGLLWHSGSVVGDPGGVGVFGLNVETMKVERAFLLPEHAHGIAIDFQGYVWGVGGSTNAYKIHPTRGSYEVFDKLVGAYTYSDMTGFELASTVDPPVE